MCKYTKYVSCKVEQWAYDKIQTMDVFQTEYLRNLIYNDLNSTENNFKSVVNHLVNDKKHDDESLSIDKKIDLILKHKNKE